MNLDLKAMKIAVLANASSGVGGPDASIQLRAELAGLSLTPHAFWCGAGGELDRVLKEMLDWRPDLLIVLGGDGTIRSAAQHCTVGGPLLMPLPGGTMNLVAGALYGQCTWQAALHAVVAKPEARTIAAAEAGGRLFAAGAMFGKPALLAEAREAARSGEMTEALKRAISAVRRTLDEEMGVLLEGETVQGEVVSVTPPLLSAGRARDPRLEVAVADLKGATDALRLLLMSPFRNWRDDPVVTRADAAEFQILSRAAIHALLDGEQFSFTSPLAIKVVPAALRVIVPARPN